MATWPGKQKGRRGGNRARGRREPTRPTAKDRGKKLATIVDKRNREKGAVGMAAGPGVLDFGAL